MIERYTRHAIGAVWSEQAKFDSWLQVELAVCDALFRRRRDPGRRPQRDQGPRHLHGRRPSRIARRSPTTTSPRSSTSSASRRRGRSLDPLRPDQQRRARHGARGTDREGRRDRDRRARASTPTRWPPAHTSSKTHSAAAALTAFTPSRPPSASSSPDSPSRHDATSTASSAPSSRLGRRALRRGRHLQRQRPRDRSHRARSLGCSPSRSALRSSRATVTPNCSPRFHWPAPALSASRPRSAHCRRPKCARSKSHLPAASRRAAPRCRTSATRSQRADHRPGARPARQRPGGGRERRPLARARHHATAAPNASSCPTPRSCWTTCSRWRPRS